VPDYTKTCFVIMPFGTKRVGGRHVDFDHIYETIFERAIPQVRLPEGGTLVPARTDKDFFAGDIGHDMFLYLHRSRFAMADITGLNPNVMYEVGVRHSARQSGTAVFRQANAPLPFDISHIKAFPYSYRPERSAAEARALVTRVLQESLAQNRLDSPVQLALRAEQESTRRSELEEIQREAENALRRFDRPAAIALLRRALRVGGANALVHVRLGLLLRDQGDLAGALEQLMIATSLQPDYADAWRERGVHEARLSDGTNGEESLRRAIALNPDDFDALASLGGILRRGGRLAEAAELYERAVSVSGGHPYPVLMALKLRARLSGALTLDGTIRRQLRLAETMRRAQAEANPPIDAPWCMFDLGEIRLYCGDEQEALQWIRKGIAASNHRYEAQALRSALHLLVDAGVALPGLAEALSEADRAVDELP
jgi:tetratricopeptide (TPR) repeat protein